MSTPLSEMIAKMRFLRPSEEFRRTFQYNSLAHHVLRTVPENLYGVSFTDYARENLLEKLNMSDTVWDIANMPPNDKRAQGFARRYQHVDACIEDETRFGFSAECLGEKLNIGYFDPRLERTFAHWGIITNGKDMVRQGLLPRRLTLF
jgi:CubicO group peptidase (beta-lactamase class C family)